MDMCKDYVEYNNFDELPEKLKEKFKSRTKGLKLDESKNGYVDFINLLNNRGDEVIGIYVNATIKTQIKFGGCGHIAKTSPNNYKSGKGCGVCHGRQIQQGINDLATTHPILAKEWHPTKNSELTPHNISQGSSKKVWWRCDKGHEWRASVDNRVNNGSNCPFCSNQRVLKGYNDIATTHPHLVELFVNVKDAYSYTYSSGKKVKLKCKECGAIKSASLNNLTRQGFSCDLCSDGVSYSEKLMGSILNKLNIEFIKQMSYGNSHRYDFFLPKIQCYYRNAWYATL